ncbi:DUF5677 domain-containing protein [Chloroflexota bacterium]
MEKEMGQQPSTNSWKDKIDKLSVYTGMVLISLTKVSQDKRDLIIRNFIARGLACTLSILRLWQTNDEQGAWILHRTLIDRLFHLHTLIRKDCFSQFEDFSFVKTYEARERLLADLDIINKIPANLRELQRANKARYQEIKTKGCLWSRPKAEDVAKEMNMWFLYNLGYDYGSTHIHPMAEDGENDYYLLITPEEKRKPLSDDTVLRNSLIVQTMLIGEGMNGTTVRWRKIVYDFLDQLLHSLKDGNIQYAETFYKIGKAYPDFNLCEKRK